MALRERERERERNKIFNFQSRPTVTALLASSYSSNIRDDLLHKPSYISASTSTSTSTSSTSSSVLTELRNESKYSNYATTLMKYGSIDDNISTTSSSYNNVISNGVQNNYSKISNGSNPNVVMNFASSGVTLSDKYIKNSDLLELRNTGMLSARNLHSKAGTGVYLKD